MSLIKTYSEGYAIEIRNGEIWAVPADGAPYLLSKRNPKWQAIAKEVAKLVSAECFIYSHHTTKPRPDRKDDQLTLVFDYLLRFQTAVVFFNVDTHYQRNSKKHKKGARRARGHFTAAKRSSLVKLYNHLGLKLPTRFSQFHQALAQLQGKIFTAQESATAGISTINKASLQLLNISSGELKALFDKKNQQPIYGGTTNQRQQYDRTKKQEPQPTSGAVTYPEQSMYKHGALQTTCNQQRVTSTPEQQSVKEWLEDYTRADQITY